jgi:hypothetical protein
LFRFLRINLPARGHPSVVAFADDATSVVVACNALSGSSLYMYGEEKPKVTGDSKQQCHVYAYGEECRLGHKQIKKEIKQFFCGMW